MPNTDASNPIVVKVVGSKSNNAIEVFLSDGKVYPYLYLPNALEQRIRAINDASNFPLFHYDFNDEEHLAEHNKVVNADDAEVLYEVLDEGQSD